VTLGASGNSFFPFGPLAYGVSGTSVSSAFISGAAAGYMETTQNSSQNVQAFIRNTFGYSTTTGR